MAVERCTACQGKGKELFSNRNCVACGGSGRKFVYDFNQNPAKKGRVIGCGHLLLVFAVFMIIILILKHIYVG